MHSRLTNTAGLLLISIKIIIKKAPFGATRWQPFKDLNLKHLNFNPTFFPNKDCFYFDIKKSDLKIFNKIF